MERDKLMPPSASIQQSTRLILSMLAVSWLMIGSGETLAKSKEQSESTLANLNVIRGIIKPAVEAVISGEIQARILEMPFTEGQRFKKGQVLVAFDCSKHEAELTVAQAEYVTRKKMLENNLEMSKLHAIGDLEVEISSWDVKKAHAAMRIAQVTVNRCRILAPFSGRVVKRFVNPHESVNPYDELLSILDDSQFKIELILPSTALRWVKKGTPFTFTIDETGQSFPAKTTELGASIDPASQTLRVRGTFTSTPKLVLAGMSGSATFSNQPDETISKKPKKKPKKKTESPKPIAKKTPVPKTGAVKKLTPPASITPSGWKSWLKKIQ